MITKRTKLAAARYAMGLSQEQLAEQIGVSRETVSLWERGITDPYPYHVEQLRLLFKKDAAELDLVIMPEDSSSIIVEDLGNEVVRTFIKRDMTTYLWDIAFDANSGTEKQSAVRQAIKEFDMMNKDNTTYQISRRTALQALATLPMITLQLKGNSVLKATHYSDVLAHCSASLEGCWQLYRSSSDENAQLAFQCASTYIPILTAISQDSSFHRGAALHLASQYALLKTLLGWGCVGTMETIQYAQEAMSLSQRTGDILLQMSAYTKLGWAYSAGQKHEKALETMQKGESLLLQGSQRIKNALPSHMVGSFYSTYALVQSRNGECPDTALGIATNSATGDEHTAFTIFTQSAQWLEAAHTCCAKGDPAQTMTWIEKRIDAETLAPHKNVSQSERGRIETINVFAHSLLQAKDHDMERVIAVWTAGMEGAKALKNEQRYNEAITNFKGMQIVWPGEKQIMKLCPLTEHW